MKKSSWITPILFLAMIFGLAVAGVLTPDKAYSEMENRYLQGKPSFSLDALMDGSYTADVETYLTDQFPLRDGFVGVKSAAEYAIGKRDTNEVYFCKDGYLIEKHTTDSVDESLVGKNIEHMAAFADRCAASLGEDHVRVLIAPTAGEILKDKLPAGAEEFSQAALFARMTSALPENCFLDLTERFSALKESTQLYYRTDHHWTTAGAYEAYLAYCESVGMTPTPCEAFTASTVSSDFYGTVYSKARRISTEPDRIEAYLPQTAYSMEYDESGEIIPSLYVEDFLEKRDQYSYFLGGNNALIRIYGGASNGKKLLVVKDSYAHCFAPFLAEQYEQIDLIDLRYFNRSLQEYMAENDFTDVLVLYNAVTFCESTDVLKMDR